MAYAALYIQSCSRRCYLDQTLWNGPASVNGSSSYCLVVTSVGWPKILIITHKTVVSKSAGPNHIFFFFTSSQKSQRNVRVLVETKQIDALKRVHSISFRLLLKSRDNWKHKQIHGPKMRFCFFKAGQTVSIKKKIWLAHEFRLEARDAAGTKLTKITKILPSFWFGLDRVVAGFRWWGVL